MHRPLSIISFSIICTLITSASVQAEKPYWNQFRGPHADGASATAKPPIQFGDKENVLWKTPIHGKGWSSPVVWDQQIWLTTAPADGTELFAVCVNLNSGQIEHDLRVFEVADPEFCHPTNSYASCTPVVEGGAYSSPLAPTAPPASTLRLVKNCGSAAILSAIISAAPPPRPFCTAIC